jgi:hypothetical protein
MKTFLVGIVLTFSCMAFSQSATVAIKLKPAGSFTGKTAKVKGFATMKGTTVEAKNIVVDLRTLETGIGVRDEHTKKHLEVSKYPEAVLVSATGSGGKGTGVIKIHGVQKQISGTYKVEGNNLNAEFPLKLSEFNITGIKYMGVGVADDVVVAVSVPIKK